MGREAVIICFLSLDSMETVSRTGVGVVHVIDGVGEGGGGGVLLGYRGGRIIAWSDWGRLADGGRMDHGGHGHGWGAAGVDVGQSWRWNIDHT